MRWFAAEIKVKLLVKSESDPEELPADIYSHIAEYLPSIDRLIDLEVETFALPDDVYGSSDREHPPNPEKAI